MVETIERLRMCLKQLEQAAGAPRLDIEWLLLRCEDTLRYQGELQRDSVQHLKDDVSRFVDDCPGLIPAALVEEVQRMPVWFRGRDL